MYGGAGSGGHLGGVGSRKPAGATTSDGAEELTEEGVVAAGPRVGSGGAAAGGRRRRGVTMELASRTISPVPDMSRHHDGSDSSFHFSASLFSPPGLPRRTSLRGREA